RTRAAIRREQRHPRTRRRRAASTTPSEPPPRTRIPPDPTTGNARRSCPPPAQGSWRLPAADGRESSQKATVPARIWPCRARPAGCLSGPVPPMVPRLAHLAQEDSHLPPGPEHIGSLTRVVHELTVRLARRYPVILGSVRYAGHRREERANGIRYLRFP